MSEAMREESIGRKMGDRSAGESAGDEGGRQPEKKEEERQGWRLAAGGWGNTSREEKETQKGEEANTKGRVVDGYFNVKRKGKLKYKRNKRNAPPTTSKEGRRSWAVAARGCGQHRV